MYEQILAWSAVALLVVLCLPLAGIHKLILEVSAWALRLALLALLGAAAYLWFYPEQLPAEVVQTLDDFPRLKAVLPDPAAQYFGISVAAPVVAALLPLLAVLDVTSKLAGRRLRRIRALTATRPAVETVQPVVAEPRSGFVVRRIDRRTAADAMMTAGARRSSGASERPAP